ncbi:MAG: prenyltransferase [Bdellovibrionaceae bacterium]|nr:prenyltransferase [Pseudobdellovibrionaceae bacterium]MBX3032801.1 prenyltransferase [Pseudobdellovibrionaceae bacterium]
MRELRTLDRRHPDFMKHLMGTFSRQHRALPLKSLNPRTETETVTFEIIPVKAVGRPPWPVVWLKALRPRSFLQVLVPMALILLASPRGSLDPDLSWLATLGVLFLQAAVLLRNDVEDHVSGLDRLRSDRGSRAIQKGWLTADHLKGVSFWLLVFSVLCALPIMWARPAILGILLVTALLGGVAFFRSGRGYKDLPGGSWLLFLLGGPLLVVGYGIAVHGTVTLENLLMGILWGWFLLFPVHLRDLEHLIAEGQSGRGSLVGRLGFDRGVKLIGWWWICGVAAFAFYQERVGAPLVFWILLFLVVLGSSFFMRDLRRLRSPAGSAVADLRRQGELSSYALVLLWILEELWRHPL